MPKQKSNKKEYEDLTWFGPNLAYVHGERTWESFINKLDTERSNFLLHATRVFIFYLNLELDYKSFFSLRTFNLLLSFLAFF